MFKSETHVVIASIFYDRIFRKIADTLHPVGVMRKKQFERLVKGPRQPLKTETPQKILKLFQAGYTCFK